MKKQDNIALSRLLEEIERYYDCSLSDTEERALRRTIASTTLSHPAIDEARAMMGFLRPEAAAAQTKRGRRITLRAAMSVAAAVAVLFTLAVGYLRHSSAYGDESTCIAYVNGGVLITDEEDIIRLIAADMREFGDGTAEAVESFHGEFDDIAPLIEHYESEIDFPEI